MSFLAASASYPMGTFDEFDALLEKWTAWIADAAEAGAELAVLPEYGGIEAAHCVDAQKARDLSGQVEVMTGLEERLVVAWKELAVRYQLHILAPSFPVQPAAGQRVNRAYFFTPDGLFSFQDKIIPTPFEREMWGIGVGGPLKIFETSLGKCAVLICYDCEFPLLARAAVEGGAEFLLVPSATEALDGYWRVRVGAMARALEGQCFVIHAALVGPCDWSPSTDENVGAAGFYGPPDLGFPDNGVIAAGGLNEPGWILAEIDPGRVAQVRQEGAVRGFQHWPEQGAALHVPLEAVSLLPADQLIP